MDLVYIYPGGVRTGSHLFFFGKSSFLKHPSGYAPKVVIETHVLAFNGIKIKLCEVCQQGHLGAWVHSDGGN